MEIIAGIGAIILLVWICSGSSSSMTGKEYTIKATGDDRYFEVIDRAGNTQHIGTERSCELWIEEHTK